MPTAKMGQVLALQTAPEPSTFSPGAPEKPPAMLPYADELRRSVTSRTAREYKAQLGQFMTPPPIARFMASLFTEHASPVCRLLDPGAGLGALSCAFIDRWSGGELHFERVDLLAYEVDSSLRTHLAETLDRYAGQLPFRSEVVAGDFIEHATMLFSPTQGEFTHVILNPPYKKINSSSFHRSALRGAGIETVNLYSAFVALSVLLAAPLGQVVAIIPRSFCNGPYYKSFRQLLLRECAVRRIHLFNSRTNSFREDDVLQENVIIHLEKGGRQAAVTISTSSDDALSDLQTSTHPFDRIVRPHDPERFIHIPTSAERDVLELSAQVRHSLPDIEISVSTGPVVDFRLKEHTRATPQVGAVPLLYPAHFVDGGIVWPKPDSKKPNAILRNISTDKWLYPTGNYCVVKRFTSKEESRRIVARVVSHAEFAAFPKLGFENHLNLFHDKGKGLPLELAEGLRIFLSMTAVDQQFRRFNGHTQVNATDLRSMKYPSRKSLIELGEWAIRQPQMTQDMIDARLETLRQ